MLENGVEIDQLSDEARDGVQIDELEELFQVLEVVAAYEFVVLGKN